MCIQLWQLDTIAVDDKFKALYDLCEEQEDEIYSLNGEIEELENQVKAAEDRATKAWNAKEGVNEEMMALERKVTDVKKMLEEVDDTGCSLDYINSILNLL